MYKNGTVYRLYRFKQNNETNRGEHVRSFINSKKTTAKTMKMNNARSRHQLQQQLLLHAIEKLHKTIHRDPTAAAAAAAAT